MSSTSTGLPVLFERPQADKDVVPGLAGGDLVFEIEMSSLFPRSVTVTNDPRLLESLLLTDEVTFQPEGSSPGRKWTSFSRMGVALTVGRPAAGGCIDRDDQVLGIDFDQCRLRLRRNGRRTMRGTNRQREGQFWYA